MAAAPAHRTNVSKEGLMSPLLRNIKHNRDFSRIDSEPEKDTLPSGLYLDFYNLKKSPFTITPDPEFLYSSLTHKTALENILYGIEACMGFILLIGEVGTGKTTLCRAVLDKLEGTAETVYIINPSLTGIEIIQAILDDLGLDYPAGATKKALLDRLNGFLMEVNTEKPVVIIIDDAQTMTPEGLEDLRLLSNLETDKKKLLQLVLVGQQELLELLSRPELRQLKQRVTICCQLDLISYAELRQYISLRLFVAGDNGRINFSERAIREIHKASHGIPRLINIICDYVLTAGYLSNRLIIRKSHARKAINDLRHQSLIDKTFLSGLSFYIKKKRIRPDVLFLFAGLLFFVFIYRENIYDRGHRTMVVQQESKTRPAAGSPGSNSVNAVISPDIVPAMNNRESSTENELTMPEDNKGNSIVTPKKNYIIQISSLRTLKMTIHEVMSLRQRGLDVHWNAVHMIEKGTWYRVYQGGFTTKKEAMAFKEEKGITEGIIIYAPWTIAVTSGDYAETPEDVCAVLREKGLDCMVEKDGDTYFQATVGAFINYERAQKVVRELLDMGFNAKPVRR